MNSFDQTELKSEYDRLHPVARRFAETLRQQIGALISKNGLSLGVPIESRVKTWNSLSEKLERKHIAPKSVLELDDLIGIRVILLFQRDLDTMHGFLNRELSVLSHENTANRLQEAQFGYQSVHYSLALPGDWLNVPTMTDFRGLKAELQVRTLSQHIWAAASHKLQYKNEQSVPLQLRRSIHRVSAILETVDLEFERLLVDRDQYISSTVATSNAGPLNVDVLRTILADEWPSENAGEEESYSALLLELREFGIESTADLRKLISDQRKCVMKDERTQLKIRVEQLEQGKPILGTSEERTERGVFFTHVGLTRTALECKDSDRYREVREAILTNVPDEDEQ
ncbi:GTP pyrophosphokinase family protein [Novipirellula sp.]|uniref:GTP pyrophosphokinase n=1 Tax=Novipirellula sp. TaxID=2795430 RepID=UPI003562598C